MRNSLKERILDALVLAVGSFVIFCVVYKLFFYREDWLSYSLMWSISWAIGMFVSETTSDLLEDEKIWAVLLVNTVIIVIVSILATFVLGVLLNVEGWSQILMNTLAPFGVSIIFNTEFH